MRSSHLPLNLLRLFALVAALLAVLSTVSGFRWIDLGDNHGILGNISFVVILLAAITAFVWARRSHNTGLLMHAAGMAVIALVQIALGEMEIRLVHQVLGVLYLVGVLALVTLAFRKPGKLAVTEEPERV